MEMKTCLDCSERVRKAARKCQFCGFRFDAPKASAMPLVVFVLGVVLAVIGANVSTVVLAMSSVVMLAGAFALAVQRRVRRAKRFTATGEFARLLEPLPLAIVTTLRGH
jgi:uncharacterized protein (DUF983 family)